MPIQDHVAPLNDVLRLYGLKQKGGVTKKGKVRVSEGWGQASNLFELD